MAAAVAETRVLAAQDFVVYKNNEGIELGERYQLTSQGHLSAVEREDSEPGASVLLAISREFGKSVDWLLTGDEKK